MLKTKVAKSKITILHTVPERDGGGGGGEFSGIVRLEREIFATI